MIETDYSSYRVTRGIVQEASHSNCIDIRRKIQDELTELEVQISLLNMVQESYYPRFQIRDGTCKPWFGHC